MHCLYRQYFMILTACRTVPANAWVPARFFREQLPLSSRLPPSPSHPFLSQPYFTLPKPSSLYSIPPFPFPQPFPSPSFPHSLLPFTYLFFPPLPSLPCQQLWVWGSALSSSSDSERSLVANGFLAFWRSKAGFLVTIKVFLNFTYSCKAK